MLQPLISARFLTSVNARTGVRAHNRRMKSPTSYGQIVGWLGIIAGGLALCLLALALVTHGSQAAFQVNRPAAEYAALLLQRAAVPRTELAIDFVFIGFYAAFFVYLLPAIQSWRNTRTVAHPIWLGALLVTALLDAVENARWLSGSAGFSCRSAWRSSSCRARSPCRWFYCACSRSSRRYGSSRCSAGTARRRKHEAGASSRAPGGAARDRLVAHPCIRHAIGYGGGPGIVSARARSDRVDRQSRVGGNPPAPQRSALRARRPFTVRRSRGRERVLSGGGTGARVLHDARRQRAQQKLCARRRFRRRLYRPYSFAPVAYVDPGVAGHAGARVPDRHLRCAARNEPGVGEKSIGAFSKSCTYTKRSASFSFLR
jgi:hypothetical protein